MVLERFRILAAADGALVAGVSSGTSADGIDVVLAWVRAHRSAGAAARPYELAPPKVLSFGIEPFPPELGARVRAVLDGAPVALRDVALLHRDLGRAFGRAAAAAADRRRLSLDLVGSHGQTVWHHDGVEPSGGATLQLGDGDFAAEEAGCAVVSDFRQRDVAAGGEGAPLSALADDLIFAAAPRPLAVLNLGGMANVTWLGAGRPLAFDVGPAGSLLDGMSRRLLDRPFDEHGEVASTGRPRSELVARLLEHPFFDRHPPKSTGRDTFGEAWVEGALECGAALGLGPASAADLLASAVEAVAASVASACERFLPGRPAVLAVAGGGARNRALVRALERSSDVPVVSSEHFGVDPDAREALVFAVLATRAALGLPSTRRAVTGAANGRVLGKLSLPAARRAEGPHASGSRRLGPEP